MIECRCNLSTQLVVILLTPLNKSKDKSWLQLDQHMRIKWENLLHQFLKPTIRLPPMLNKTKDLSGSTYADQMARTKSKISSDHAPPKPEGLNSPKRSPAKSAVPQSPSLDASRYASLRICANEVGLRNLLPIALHLRLWKEVGISLSETSLINSWSGKLATASDPYFQNPPGSPMSAPQDSHPLDPIPEPVSFDPPPDIAIIIVNDQSDSSQPTDTAPNTPASVSTSGALEVEEYFDLLEADDEEEDRYNADPDRRKRDLEINERVNRAIAEAEEAALAREILSPRASPAERKTVQFAAETQTHIVENNYGEDVGEPEVMTKTVYVWNTFRDFVTARSITGFEEYVPEPRMLRSGVSSKSGGIDEKSEESVREKAGKDKREGKVEMTLQDFAKVDPQTSTKEIPAAIPIPPSTVPPTSTTTHTPVTVVPPKPDVLSPHTQPEIAPQQGPDSLPLATVTTTKPTFVPVKVALPFPPIPIAPVPPTVPTTALAVPVAMPVAVPTQPSVQPAKLTSSPAPVNWNLIQIEEIKTVPSIKPEPYKPEGYQARYKTTPVSVLKDVEPPVDVASTWDMPTTPAVRIGTENRKDGGQRQVADDPFLLGLTASKKVEAKPEVKKVVVVEEPKWIEIPEDGKVAKTDALTVILPVEVPNAPAPTTPAVPANIKSPVIAPRPMPGVPTFAAMAGPIPSLARPLITSPPPTSCAKRSGMPVPVPAPPTPKPAIKSPTKATPVRPIIIATPVIPIKPIVAKPAVAPKPANLLSTPKTKAALSPVVGGLIDPFLAGLQPEAKKQQYPVRPKTPSVSTDSAESTPEKSDSSTEEKLALFHKIPLDNSLTAESAPTSPTSLGSSWTLIEKIKNGTSTRDVSSTIRSNTQSPNLVWFRDKICSTDPCTDPRRNSHGHSHSNTNCRIFNLFSQTSHSDLHRKTLRSSNRS